MSIIKLMIIDDEKWVRVSIKNLIHWDRLSLNLIDEADNGNSGLQSCKIHKPDIVLTDIRMPGLSGIEIMQKVAEINPETLFIVISGYGEFNYVQQALKLGAFDYLLKPIKEEVINPILSRAKAKILAKRNKKSELKKMKNIIKKLEDSLECNSDELTRKMHTDDRFNLVLDYIKNNFHSENISLEAAADKAYMSKTYFSKCFKKRIGIGFLDYITRLRLDKAKHLLTTTTLAISEIAFSCGFRDKNYFAKVFKNNYQCTPSEYREKNLIA